jgi:hypothetical protein
MNSAYRITFLFILLCSAIGSMHSAQAQEPEEKVTSGTLKIVGRGLQDRKTGDIIALSCMGPALAETGAPSCKTLRHVIFPANSTEAYYVGYTYQLEMESEPTEKDFETLAKSINRNVKKFKKNMHQDTREKVIGYGAFAGATGWGVHLIALSATGVTVTIGAALLPFYAGIALTFGIMMIARIPLLPHSGVISEAMADQNGWNWSESPNVISHQRFKWFDRYLK